MSEPTQNEIDGVIDECAEFIGAGESKYPGMSYEEGIRAAIDWIQNDGENPME